MNQKIIIIGGGAAGFFGAISAANHQPQAEITILEASKQLLDKVKYLGAVDVTLLTTALTPVN